MRLQSGIGFCGLVAWIVVSARRVYWTVNTAIGSIPREVGDCATGQFGSRPLPYAFLSTYHIAEMLLLKVSQQKFAKFWLFPQVFVPSGSQDGSTTSLNSFP